MDDIPGIISKLSEKAKIELIVFAQSTPEIINPFIDEELEDPQTELDILYELGFLELDGDEDDEEYAKAEFSSDVRQYLNEEIGNVKGDALITAVLSDDEYHAQLVKEAPTASKELNAILYPPSSEPEDILP